jgi:hypothetical protein
MTLERAVIDLRTHFWEHGQLYVALSTARQTVNLCILMPDSFDSVPTPDPAEIPLRVPVDRDVMEIIPRMCSTHISEVHTLPSIPASARRSSQCPVDDFARVEQSDHHIDHDSKMRPVLASNFTIQ